MNTSVIKTSPRLVSGALIMTSALMMAACSSNSSSGVKFTQLSAVTTTEETNTLAAQASAEGQTIEVPANQKVLGFGDEQTSSIVGEAANIKVVYANNNGSNAIESVTISDSSGDIVYKADTELSGDSDFRKDGEGGNYTGLVASHGGTWNEYGNGTSDHKYMIPVRTMSREGDVYSRGYSVVGLETGNITSKTGTATYSGNTPLGTGGLVGDAVSDNSGNSARTRIYGNIALTVDFDKSEFKEGKITNIRTGRDNGATNYAVSELDISSARFTGNGFSTTLSCVDAAKCDNGSISDTQFTATFYGNDAQEAGGTASWSYAAGDGTGSTLTDQDVGAVWTANAD